MNCICGCGARLERDQVGTNLLAGEVAIELVVWDKARALGPPVAAAEVAALLSAGAPHYQDLLAAIHRGAEPGEGEVAAIQRWLEESRAARQRLHRELPVPKKKISLSGAEQAQIDRRHPERSFSGASAEEEPAAGEAGGERPPASEPGVDPLLEALLVVALEDVRAGRPEEAKRALRRFLSDGG